MKPLQRVIAFLLTFTIIFSMVPFGMTEAKAALDISVKTDKEKISLGKKGVDYTASHILIVFNSSWKLKANRSLNEVKVTANDKTDETFKFDLSFTAGKQLKLTLKKPVPNQQPPYRLNPSSLYSIHIPPGLFIDGKANINQKIDFSFVTKGESGQTDLLKSTRLAHEGKSQESIELEYVDVILADVNKLKKSIKIDKTWIDAKLKDPYKKEQRAESIDDFDIVIEDNKLLLKPKADKKIANFCNYNINIPKGEIYLKNSPYITNDDHAIAFTTYKMMDSTYPENNQTGIQVKPTIMFAFKHPVTIVDKDKIILQSHGEKYPLNNNDITISANGKILSISVGKTGDHPLRRNTLYKVVISKGVVKFTDKIINEEDIILTFTTRSEGQSPEIIRYSSSQTGIDDITSISQTKLSRDGYIYINFDRNIKWEKNSGRNDVIQGTKLYKIPKAKSADYDEGGELYDKVFEFEGDITEAELRKCEEKVGVDEVTIVNGNSLRVKPSLPLINLNQYRLTMDKHFIEDINGYSIEENIDFYFWTAPLPEKPIIKWEGIEGINTGIEKDDKASGTTYTVSGAPAYGPQNPLVLNIDGEVIPKAGDIAVLSRISLVEGYDNKEAGKIDEVHFEYYFEGGKKKTRLYLIPKENLSLGKYYILVVPQNTLQGRSGTYLPSMIMNFTVAGNKDFDPGIYGLVPNTLKYYDIYKGNATFSIRGYNFTEDVKSIELTMKSGNSEPVKCTIDKKDIQFRSVTELLVKLRDPGIVDELIKGGSAEYLVKVFFDKNTEPVKSEDLTLTILPRGKPVVLAKDPTGGDIWQNEKMLNSRTIDGITRYFLKVTFEDLDGSLTFDGDSGLNLLQTSTLFSEGQNEISMLDQEFINFIQNLDDENVKKSYIDQYIFVKSLSAKEAYLYVPVKPLRSQTTYTVMINRDIVYYDGPDKSTEANDVIPWSFTTTATPVVASVDMGSVGEDYDEDEPIWLQGDFFDERNIEVFFNDIRARRVKMVTHDNGKTFLEVYLPDGRDRLEPGIYTIRVRNDRDHEFEIFGSLSVVKEGEHVPNEEYTVKAELRMGDILSDTKVSEDTLILDRRYTDWRYLDIDLDDLMGEDVLVRKIQFDGRKSDRIGTLETISKWADVFLYDVGVGSNKSDEEPELKLGRIEPLAAQNLKARLGRQQPKSEMIQVIGKDMRFSSIKTIIPFKESDGENLKVLRYDSYTRNFYEEPFFVDKIDKIVTISSYSEGIFVVVEK